MQNMQEQKQQMDNMETGTTTLGLVSEDGVVLATDNRATIGNLKASKKAQKVYQLDDQIGLTIAGSVGDAQRIVRVMRSQLKLYKLETKAISVEGAATLLSNILQSSKMLPYMNQFVIGGLADEGGVLYDLDPMGGLMEHDEFTATGSGSTMAYGVLEDAYDEGMAEDDAVELAVRAVSAATERDVASGDGIDVVTITEEGYQEVDDDRIEDLL